MQAPAQIRVRRSHACRSVIAEITAYANSHVPHDDASRIAAFISVASNSSAVIAIANDAAAVTSAVRIIAQAGLWGSCSMTGLTNRGLQVVDSPANLLDGLLRHAI